MIKQLLLCCIATSALSLSSLPSMAAETGRIITVYGHASRDVEPNQANIHISLRSESKELAQAKASNDAKLAKLYEIAGNHQIEKRHMKAGYNSVRPKYRYSDGRQIMEGYEANLSVTMTVNKMDNVGPLLQELAETGVTLDNVSYSIDKEQLLRDEVMLEALDNARDKAEKMATRLGQRIGDPVQISEGQTQHERPQPMVMGKAMMAAEAAPMAPPAGEQEVNVTVTVSFELQ